jgi:hypothetical protein
MDSGDREHDKTRMIRIARRQLRKSSQARPHTLPVLDQRSPAAAILEHAVEQAVRYGILRQEDADARDDVNHVRPVRELH